MFIANTFLERADAPEGMKYKKFGSIWWDEEKKRASIRFTGFPAKGGTFAARPFPRLVESGMDLPYIQGDLKMRVGAYTDREGQTKNEYQWIGHIQSDQDGEGNTIYVGAIEVVPVFAAMERGGVFCPVFSEQYQDAETKQPQAQEAGNGIDDSDGIPF